MGTGVGCLLGLKRPARNVDHTHPSVAYPGFFSGGFRQEFFFGGGEEFNKFS
jgi:hypothetical protein